MLRYPSRHRFTSARLAGAAVALGLAASPAWAQDGNGFLLGAPVGSLSVRAGYDRAFAGSDIFSFATQQLTLSKNDFSSLTGAADLAVRLSDRLDFGIGVGISGSNARSRVRGYLDNEDLPIEQNTKFLRVPLTATVKAYLAPRGRSVGRLAWIPTRFSPYVGAGGGVLWHRFEQTGDFVDFKTLDVFSTTFTTSRWAPEAHALTGMDYSLSPRFALTGELRYTWARSPISNSAAFAGFDKIDLSGAAATAGVSVRF